MNDKLQRFVLHQKVHFFVTRMIYPTMAFVFCTVFAFQVYSTYLTWGQRTQALEDLSTAESIRQTIAQSQSLTETERDYFTTVLSNLIPETEDAFSLGDAVVNMMTQANMYIDTFTPPSPSDIEGPINSVTVKVSGNREDFDRLLQTYMFSSGRFVTMESCIVTYVGDEVTADMTLMFHTAPTPKGSAGLVSFTSLLKNKLIDIQDLLPRYTDQLSPQDAAIDTEYDTKAPF